MRTLAIVNQKGGSGKTTTAINLAAVYARRGFRTLLVDMDPQSHCAVGLGVPERQLERSIADALIGNLAKFDFDSLLWEVNTNLHLAPSTMRLATLEAPGGGLHELPDKDRRLEAVLAHLAPRFDRCLIDCPPTIGLLTFNALRACRETLIPVETGFFALRGAEKQWQTIQRLISHINRPIACHLLATLYNPNSNLARDILSALRREFAGQILPIVIEEHESLREAASFGQPIVEFTPESDARRQFEQLADWLEEHTATPVATIETFTHERAAVEALSSRQVTSPVDSAMHTAQAQVSAVVDTRHSERAAELVRRVQNLTRGESASPAPPPSSGQPFNSPSTETTLSVPQSETTAVQTRGTCTSVPSIGPQQRVVAIDIETRPAAVHPDHVASPASSKMPRSGHTHLDFSIHRASPPSISPPRSADLGLRSVERAIEEIRELIQPIREQSFEWPPRMPLTLPRPRVDQVCEIKPRILVRPEGYGVCMTADGVVFTQPAGIGNTAAIAGDFNRWSPRAHPLTPVPGSEFLQLLVKLPPGRHLYRLVVDGRWQADPYNALQARNALGELHSVIEVPDSTLTESPLNDERP